MLNTEFSPWPSFTDSERAAVDRVLQSNRVNYWTGNEVKQFEKEFANYFESEYAIALANGTVALDLCLQGLGITAGDEVIVTPRSFIASVSCVVNAGATPVFADVDLNSQCLSAETIKAKISNKTKAVIVVHLAGFPADMDPIMDLANAHGFKIIEDCAQAHGAKYKGRSVGSIGHLSAWSFCQDKIMTTGGEGGMVTTDDKALWSSMWSFKDHGKSYETVHQKPAKKGYRWLHESFGTNWRMMEMQAAIGREQIKMMPQWHTVRLNNLISITDACRSIDWLEVPDLGSTSEHAAYRAYALIKPERLPEGWSRDSVINTIAEQGVPVFSGTCSEIYNEKAFEGLDFKPASPLSNARYLGEHSLMFLVHPTLTKVEIEKTCAVIKSLSSKVSYP